MRRVRVVALLAIGVVLLFHAVRLLAAGCSGNGCEWFIPISLYLPLTGLALAVITGVLAVQAVPAGSPWRLILAAAILVTFAGPVAAVVIFRNSPDLVVPIATVLMLTAPVAALTASVRAETLRNRDQQV